MTIILKISPPPWLAPSWLAYPDWPHHGWLHHGWPTLAGPSWLAYPGWPQHCPILPLMLCCAMLPLSRFLVAEVPNTHTHRWQVAWVQYAFVTNIVINFLVQSKNILTAVCFMYLCVFYMSAECHQHVICMRPTCHLHAILVSSMCYLNTTYKSSVCHQHVCCDI